MLAGDEQYPFVDQRGQAAIDEWRGELGELLRCPGHSLQQTDSNVTWWSFAGGRINHTLKYALESEQGWKVIADNFSLRLEGNAVSLNSTQAAMAKLRAEGFWENLDTRRKLLAKVPEYRWSKFQRALPAPYEVEMVGSYLLDFEGTARWVRD